MLGKPQNFIGKAWAMKKFILIAWLALSYPLLAANVTDISELLAQPEALTGQFAQEKHMQLLSMPLKSSGSFAVVKDTGVIWQLEKPVNSTMTITEHGLKGVDIDDNRAMQYVGKLLMQLLSGEFSTLEKQFSLQAEIEKEQWQLKLEPRSALIKKAVLSISLAGSRYIQMIELKENGGDKTVIRLLEHQEHSQAARDVLDVLQEQ